VDLFQALFDWLREVLGVDKRPEIQPLESYTQGDRTLKLLFNEYSDNDFPGLVALWVCECDSASQDCLILVANLAQLREWLYQINQHTETPEQQSFRRILEIKARAAIRQQYDRVNATHLFMVGSIRKGSITKGNSSFRQLDCSGAWLVDLVGIHTYFGQNAIAYRTTKSIALKVLSIDSSPLNSWEDIIFEAVPWLDWLEQFSRAHMKSKNHRIQPPKMSRKNGKP
jgi:hypothetical protein